MITARLQATVRPGMFRSERIVSFEDVRGQRHSIIADSQSCPDDASCFVSVLAQNETTVDIELPRETITGAVRFTVPRAAIAT